MQKLEIKGVKVGQRFMYDNHNMAEVVDFYEQKSMVTGEIIGYICIAKGVNTLSTNLFETSFSRVIRFKRS